MNVAIHRVPAPPDGWDEYRQTRIGYLMRRRFPLPASLVFDGNIPEDYKGFEEHRAGRSPEDKQGFDRELARLKALSNGALNREFEAEQAREGLEQHQAKMRKIYARCVDFPWLEHRVCAALLAECDPDEDIPDLETAKRQRHIVNIMLASIDAGELKAKLKQPETHPPVHLIKPGELIRWATNKPSVLVPPALREEFEKRADPTSDSLEPDRPAAHVNQKVVEEWYAERWNGRVKEGLPAPSRDEDEAALKLRFAGKATRAMLIKERVKHPELKKSGRGRKPLTE